MIGESGINYLSLLGRENHENILSIVKCSLIGSPYKP